MSQHDYDITPADGNSGEEIMAAVNLALKALASNNSGAAEPGTKYLCELWADTTSGYMKIRNVGNTAWINLWKLDGSAGGLFCPIAGPGSNQAFAAGALSVSTSTIDSWALNIANTAGTGHSFGLTIAAGSNSTDFSLLVRDRSNSNDYLSIKGDGSVSMYGGLSVGTRFRVYGNTIADPGGSTGLALGPTAIIATDQTGTATDNTKALGTAAYRYSTVYAGTGAINTSDAREKTTVISLTEDELNASKQLAKEIGTFQFLSALAEKGDSARHHIGMTVQRVIEIMTTNGLDPMKYAFICFDEWVETETTPAGNRYGFRTDQLLLFIARGFEQRLTALEALM